MNSSAVTKEGLAGARPGREAPPGGKRPARRRGQPGQHDSYYGMPVIKAPVWEAREIAGYFFLGGLAGASSVVALGASLSGRPTLARGAKIGAAGAVSLSLAALIKDLGRPARFLNMLRVCKPTSPMSVGTWLVSAYAPAAIAAAASDLTGLAPAAGFAATCGAAALGPAVAAYTGVLICDTAVPAWHEGRRVMPFLFTASASAAAAGWGLACAPDAESAPVRRLAVLAAAGELAAAEILERQLDPVVAGAYKAGKARTLKRAGQALSAAGAIGAVAGAAAGAAGQRSTALRMIAGAALLAGSACTRFAVFHAGMASARDPRATIEPQRARLADRGR